MTSSVKKIIILGGGGHARVIIQGLGLQEAEIHGIIDPGLSKNQKILGLQVMGGDELLDQISPQEYDLVIGIGILPGKIARRTVSKAVRKKDFEPITFVHPTAILSPTVKLGSGVQVMAGAVVQNDVYLGNDVVVNTGAILDHETTVGAGSWISPGVTICAGVSIGRDCYIGAGATIIQEILVGDNELIPAGNTIVMNVVSSYS